MAARNRYVQYAFPDLRVGDQDYRWCHRYAHDVINDKIPAGKWIKKACERHLSDLTERGDVYFDKKAAQSVVNWFKMVPITDGKKRGQKTVLLPWQIFVCCSLIGWKITATGFRKYKYAYVQVGRKNGKSTLAGGLTLYLMYITYKEGGHRPRCYSIATKREQAKELWSAAKTMINLSRDLQQVFKPMANEIQLPRVEGVFKPLASESHTLDGLNPLMVNLDECHAIKDHNIYGVMLSAFGAQEEGLLLTITTAGTILDGLCTDLNKNGKSTLEIVTETDGLAQDSYFYAIYELDKNDQWDDETNWYKANPGLGYQPRLDYMRDMCDEARLTAVGKSNFLTKHCNFFVSPYDKWLDYDEVLACRFEKDYSDYAGMKCYAGIDRSLSHDITSLCLLFPNKLFGNNTMGTGGADAFYINLLPKKTMMQSSDYLKQIYQKAVDAGNLILVDTPTIGDDDVIKIIMWAFENFDVEMMGYDPYQMKSICEPLADKGYKIVSVSQGTGNMSEPAKKLEQLIKESIFRYNDVLFEFGTSCAVAHITGKNNMQVKRENDKTDKIDPVIATIIALSCATLQEAPPKNPYDKRGLTCV